MSTTSLTITTHGGADLAALYDKPETKGKHPLVILLHGNTGWKEEEHISTLASKLANNGIAALRFDAPGSGESQGSWEKDYRVSNYLAATIDVYDYAVHKLDADSENIGVWGHSMGGLVAIHAVARNPGKFQAVCGSQPSSGDMSRILGQESEKRRQDGGLRMKTERFGEIWLPAEYFLDRQQFVTEEAIRKIHVPVLLIAGIQDKLVSRESVKKLYEAANGPKRYLEFPTDHFYKRDSDMTRDINDPTVEFFRKNFR